MPSPKVRWPFALPQPAPAVHNARVPSPTLWLTCEAPPAPHYHLQGVLNEQGCAVVSRLIYYVYIPALTFSKLAQAVTLSSIAHLWPLLANMTIRCEGSRAVVRRNGCQQECMGHGNLYHPCAAPDHPAEQHLRRPCPPAPSRTAACAQATHPPTPPPPHPPHTTTTPHPPPSILFGLALGAALARLLRCPLDLRFLVVISCAFSNVGNLPLGAFVCLLMLKGQPLHGCAFIFV